MPPLKSFIGVHNFHGKVTISKPLCTLVLNRHDGKIQLLCLTDTKQVTLGLPKRLACDLTYPMAVI